MAAGVLKRSCGRLPNVLDKDKMKKGTQPDVPKDVVEDMVNGVEVKMKKRTR